MTEQRYLQWMAVWEWFQRRPQQADTDSLYDLLNEMWQEDRQATNEVQMAGFLEAWRGGRGETIGMGDGPRSRLW
jgi:hypothetical protein